MRSVQALAVAALLLLPAFDGASAGEPKQGGILRVYHRDSLAAPRSMRAPPIRSTFPSCRSSTTSSYSAGRGPEQRGFDCPDLAESWAWSSDNRP